MGSSDEKKRSTVARLRDEVRGLGRQIREITQKQMRVAKRYNDDDALDSDEEFRRLSQQKARLAKKYLAVSKRYQRVRDQLDE
jgi:hypothetical protein